MFTLYKFFNSQDLEETTAENAKVENEVILLRKRVYGLNKSQSQPTLVTSSCLQCFFQCWR